MFTRELDLRTSGFAETFMHTRKFSIRFVFRDESEVSVMRTFFSLPYPPLESIYLEIVDSTAYTCSLLFNNTFKRSAAMLLNNSRFSLFFLRVDVAISI
jgi:hypothetical protein